MTSILSLANYESDLDSDSEGALSLFEGDGDKDEEIDNSYENYLTRALMTHCSHQDDASEVTNASSKEDHDSLVYYQRRFPKKQSVVSSHNASTNKKDLIQESERLSSAVTKSTRMSEYLSTQAKGDSKHASKPMLLAYDSFNAVTSSTSATNLVCQPSLGVGALAM